MIVRVFRNLTAARRGKPPVYSIHAHVRGKGWRLFAHARHVCLSEATFRVSAAGVKRIRETEKKSVVATVQGTLLQFGECGAGYPDPVREQHFQSVRFNPMQMDTFQTLEGKAIQHAGTVWLGQRGVVASVER